MLRFESYSPLLQEKATERQRMSASPRLENLYHLLTEDLLVAGFPNSFII